MSVWKDIVDFLLPRRCVMCGNRLTGHEQHLCMTCFMRLPMTDYHKVEHSLLEKQFWGQFPVGRAVAMFHHEGEQTRHILYNIKYWRHPELATYLATIYAKELQEIQFFEDVDAIIPLPLHWRRQMKRHYNQSHYIAQGISKVTGLPIYKNVVQRTTNNLSQTRMNAHQRQENVKGIFLLKHPETIAGKHLLLVDDVTTTGATLISCAKELVKAPGVTISILTLAVAGRTPIPASQDDYIDPSAFGIPLLN